MCNTPIESYGHLPSPPLSPSRHCDRNLEIEPLICNIQEKDIKGEDTLCSPIESTNIISEEDVLRISFMNIIDQGIKINDEIVPYQYYIQKLHKIGNKVINKRTKDALPLRVYETGTENYKEFWVHPMILSLQSFQFFKLFKEIKNNKEEIIEIEVPSLDAFAVVLYYIYTGDNSKILEIGKLDGTLCQGIINNIQSLEVIIE
ncbi:hypothetical protein H8356DRAFT_1703851 [Neocallimastix lanati (nom. inval.)]|jgi:hypothetical protein|nr:hypothetical protein H8356DRAFT_1703851 [Neocallimastix sp. JGI-2020a]